MSYADAAADWFAGKLKNIVSGRKVFEFRKELKKLIEERVREEKMCIIIASHYSSSILRMAADKAHIPWDKLYLDIRMEITQEKVVLRQAYGVETVLFEAK